MSSNVFRLIPTDPRWQPTRVQGERARDLAVRIVPPSRHQRAGHQQGEDVQLNWHAAIEFVDCGSNLERIACPRCSSTIDTAWWADQLDERYDDGFDDLAVSTPCCGRECGLDELEYDWPCGFARFEIEIWNPDRDPFSAGELAALGDALGHRVRLVIAHV